MRDTVAEIVDDLSDYADEPPDRKEGEPAEPQIPIVLKEQLPASWQVDHSVLCIASRSPLDEAAAEMLAQLLEKHGLAAMVQPFTDVASVKTFKIDALDAPLVCLSYFGAVANPAHVRYLIRRLKRLMPRAKFLAGYWMLGESPDKGEEWRTAVGAHFVATSLTDAVAICVREAHGPGRDLAPRKIHALSAALPVSH